MKLRRRTYRSGRIGWQLDYGMVDGCRKQVAFATEEEAQAALKAALKARAQYGVLGAHMTPADAAELAVARERLQGESIIAAVEYFLSHRKTEGPPRPRKLQDAVSAFHEVMWERGRSRRTRETMRCALNPFALRFVTLHVHEVTREHILGWLRANAWARRTQRGYLGHLRTFLSWAEHEGHILQDVTKGIVLGGEQTEEIGTLTLDECRRLLTAAQPVPAGQRSLLGYIALGMFCGLRRAEIERLTWADVRLGEKVVVISSEKAKTRTRRIVDIPANTIPWLRLDPAHRTQKRICPARFKEHWKALRAAAGIIRWPNNALRHTYASMHYAQHQNENLLAAQMGNSPVMVHRHYRAMKTKAEAFQFWKLRPERRKPARSAGKVAQPR